MTAERKLNQKQKMAEIVKAAKAANASDIAFCLTAHKYVGRSEWNVIIIENDGGYIVRYHKNDIEQWGGNSAAEALAKLTHLGGVTNMCLSIGRMTIEADTLH